MNNEEAWYPEEMHFQCLDYTDSIKYHSPAEVRNWVKAFVEDFPQRRSVPVDGLSIMRYYRWLDKWFSQFIESE